MSTGFNAAAETRTSPSAASGASISSIRGTPPSSWRRAARIGFLGRVLVEQRLQVERAREHRHALAATVGARPLLDGTVAVELDAVAVVVGEVDRLADAVVGGALERDPGREHAPEGIGERRPVR